MTYRLKQDPDTLMKARTILASPNLWGAAAWDLSEENLIQKAELYMNTLMGNTAAVRLAARPISKAIAASLLGRFVGYKPALPDEYERLMECAA